MVTTKERNDRDRSGRPVVSVMIIVRVSVSQNSSITCTINHMDEAQHNADFEAKTEISESHTCMIWDIAP